MMAMIFLKRDDGGKSDCGDFGFLPRLPFDRPIFYLHKLFVSARRMINNYNRGNFFASLQMVGG